MKLFRLFIADQKGATAIEYGLIATLVSIIIFGALGASGLNLSGYYEYVGGEIIAAFGPSEQ